MPDRLLQILLLFLAIPFKLRRKATESANAGKKVKCNMQVAAQYCSIIGGKWPVRCKRPNML